MTGRERVSLFEEADEAGAPPSNGSPIVESLTSAETHVVVIEELAPILKALAGDIGDAEYRESVDTFIRGLAGIRASLDKLLESHSSEIPEM